VTGRGRTCDAPRFKRALYRLSYGHGDGRHSPAPLRPSPWSGRSTHRRVLRSGPVGSHVCNVRGVLRTMMSKPLAYSSTLDHRHVRQRNGVLRGGALEPGARSDSPKIPGEIVHLSFRCDTERHGRTFLSQTGPRLQLELFKLSITLLIQYVR
jgi:hypothetical protein